jgi:Co/Zn/Cd efflux system component
MALLADGAHMATMSVRLGLAAGAYWLARRHASGRLQLRLRQVRRSGRLTSPFCLGVTRCAVAVESIQRIVTPVASNMATALLIACIGLGGQLVSARILRDDSHDMTRPLPRP